MRFEEGVGEYIHQHLTLLLHPIHRHSWLTKGVILAFSQNSCSFSLAVQIIFVTLQRDSIFDDNEYTGNDTADSRVLQDATRLESCLYTFQFSI